MSFLIDKFVTMMHRDGLIVYRKICQPGHTDGRIIESIRNPI